MKVSFFKKLLKKYNSGTAEPAEQFVLDTWYESFDHDQEISIPGLSDRTEAEHTRLRIFNKIHTVDRSLPWYRNSWLQFAASILIISGISLGYLKFQDKSTVEESVSVVQVYQTGHKEIKKILLRDSTVIWLNANSTLRVPKSFGSKERRLALTGEANFEVQRDTLRPFLVDTRAIQVRVLGTAFNLRAYPELQEVKVSVSHGLVQVNKGTRKLAVLTKDRSLQYHSLSQNYDVQDIKAESSHAWITGQNKLEKAGFNELQQAMLNVYGLKIRTKNRKVKNFKYNITIRSNQSQKDALSMLMRILNKNYKQEESNEIIIY